MRLAFWMSGRPCAPQMLVSELKRPQTAFSVASSHTLVCLGIAINSDFQSIRTVNSLMKIHTSTPCCEMRANPNSTNSNDMTAQTLARLVVLKSEIAILLKDVEGDLNLNSADACKLVIRAAEELSRLANESPLDQSVEIISSAIRRDIAKIHTITSHIAQFENDIDLMISIRQLHYRNRTRIAHKLLLPDPTVGTSFNRSGISKSSKLQLRNWLEEHCRFPYPTANEERDLQDITGLNKRQLDYWLMRLRRRLQQAHVSSDLQCIFGFSGYESFP
ncbi:hypothetical protein V1517DRAFT_324553 [Lipomyces orientalis]|uniref:Uncharacterized protein n=1 Tax=Lipomyces orientalis TaxID=1233043 RepID=A0ACC3TM46_9ASCO